MTILAIVGLLFVALLVLWGGLVVWGLLSGRGQ